MRFKCCASWCCCISWLTKVGEAGPWKFSVFYRENFYVQYIEIPCGLSENSHKVEWKIWQILNGMPIECLPKLLGAISVKYKPFFSGHRAWNNVLSSYSKFHIYTKFQCRS